MSLPAVIRVHPDDDVAVVVEALAAGTTIAVDGLDVALAEDVPAGHKVALRARVAGDAVRKYGFRIGHATAAIAPGQWVHEHNLASDLGGAREYRYRPAPAADDDPTAADTLRAGSVAAAFDGYRRPRGPAGTRNEIWVLPTVGCVNRAAVRIAERARARLEGAPGVDGVHAFPHPFGCSQLGDDLGHTRRILAGLVRHPNAGGALILGLGCENNQTPALLAAASDIDRSRVATLLAQEVDDEIEAGVERVVELAARMAGDRREERPLRELAVGLKCGGSDGFSGLTANPLVGDVADRVVAGGGGALLTEVPEMFGAEQVLMARAADKVVFRAVGELVNGFKRYFERHGQPVDANPSPGNKTGGLTTLEEKSLGAIQKGGRSPVAGVLRYGEPLPGGGLWLLEAPGNDGVSSTAMVASGATVLLFTTGRGTPLGFPAPTIKIASGSDLATRKSSWIDFDAGRLLAGTPRPALADELFRLVLDVASGRRPTRNEERDDREIAIWKDGVTL